MQFTPNILTAGDYLCYQWHPYRADASASVPHIINYNGGTTTIYANQQTNAGNWSLLGQFNFAAGTAGYIRVTDGIPEAGAVAMADGVKLVFVPPTSVPATPSGLIATAVSSNQINLAWTDNATNETTCFVGSSAASGGPYTTIAALPANSTSYSNTGLAAGATYLYVVWATNYLGASPLSAETNATTIGGATPPVITVQPQDQTANQGANATFSVTASGTAPLAYQWRLYTTNISGATASSYTRANVQPADAGPYSVVVTNVAGSVTSSNANLTVNVPPAITAQPQSLSVTVGSNAVFSVNATGTSPLSYQWQLKGTNISGATGTSFTRSPAQTNDAGVYGVVITNVAGNVTSSNATLTVNVPPTITAQPQGLRVWVGSDVTFTVTAAGTSPLSYQWRFNGTSLARSRRPAPARGTASRPTTRAATPWWFPTWPGPWPARTRCSPSPRQPRRTLIRSACCPMAKSSCR